MVSAFDQAQAFAEARQARSGIFRLRSPLRWWKLVATAAFSQKDTERLARAVARESAGILEKLLIERGLSDDGNGAIQCALQILETLDKYTHQDIAMSWALLAVARGKRIAALIVIEGLRDLITRLRFHRSQATETALSVPLWHLYARLLSWVELSELGEVVKAEVARSPRTVEQEVSSPVEAGPTLRPTAYISDVGRRGAEYRKQFDGLTQPLPLRGGERDIDRVELELLAAFPWFEDAILSIGDDLRLRRFGNLPFAQFRPTLLLGPPGIGKTRFAVQLAHALNLPLRVIAGGAMTHTADLSGLSRIYETSQPSVVAQTMLRQRTANPIVFIDELDKSATESDERGRLLDVLLGFLEPETARCMPDECLLTTVNYSAVSWLMTANEAAFLSKPLRDRLRIITVQAPGRVHWSAILAGLRQDIAAEYDLDPEDLPILADEVVIKLRQLFVEGASLRRIRRAMIAAFATWLRPSPRN